MDLQRLSRSAPRLGFHWLRPSDGVRERALAEGRGSPRNAHSGDVRVPQ
jgi:hypothetical protein